MPGKSDSPKLDPEAVLRSLIDRYDQKAQKLIRSVRTALRKRLPTVNELVYDYSSQVVIAYGATDKGIDAILSIGARPDGVRLYFNQGTQLADPKRLLRGSGKQARYVEVEAVSQLAAPGVEALIGAAIDLASVPLPSEGKGKLIVRPTAASKRAARKPAK